VSWGRQSGVLRQVFPEAEEVPEMITIEEIKNYKLFAGLNED